MEGYPGEDGIWSLERLSKTLHARIDGGDLIYQALEAVDRMQEVVKDMREAVNSKGYDEAYVWTPATEGWLTVFVDIARYADRLEGK